MGDRMHHFADLLHVVTLEQGFEKEKKEFLKAWMKRLKELHREGFHLTDVDYGYAFRRLLRADPKTAQRFYKQYKSQIIALNASEPTLVSRQLLYLELIFDEEVPGLDRKAIRKAFATKAKQKNTGPSALELSAKKWLSGLGIPFEFNIYDPDKGAIELDFLVTLDDGRRVNIELDGPHHFVVDSFGQRHLRLADIRRDEMLNKMGIEVYRIPYYLFKDKHLPQLEEHLFDHLTTDISPEKAASVCFGQETCG